MYHRQAAGPDMQAAGPASTVYSGPVGQVHGCPGPLLSVDAAPVANAWPPSHWQRAD